MEADTSRSIIITWGVSVVMVGLGFVLGGPYWGIELICIGALVAFVGHFPNLFRNIERKIIAGLLLLIASSVVFGFRHFRHNETKIISPESSTSQTQTKTQQTNAAVGKIPEPKIQISGSIANGKQGQSAPARSSAPTTAPVRKDSPDFVSKPTDQVVQNCPGGNCIGGDNNGTATVYNFPIQKAPDRVITESGFNAALPILNSQEQHVLVSVETVGRLKETYELAHQIERLFIGGHWSAFQDIAHGSLDSNFGTGDGSGINCFVRKGNESAGEKAIKALKAAGTPCDGVAVLETLFGVPDRVGIQIIVGPKIP